MWKTRVWPAMGYIVWRNLFLGFDSWARLKYKNTVSFGWKYHKKETQCEKFILERLVYFPSVYYIHVNVFITHIRKEHLCLFLFVKHATAYKEVNISTYTGRVLTLWNSFLSGDPAWALFKWSSWPFTLSKVMYKLFYTCITLLTSYT